MIILRLPFLILFLVALFACSAKGSPKAEDSAVSDAKAHQLQTAAPPAQPAIGQPPESNTAAAVPNQSRPVPPEAADAPPAASPPAQRAAILEVTDFTDGVTPGPYQNVWGVFVGVSTYQSGYRDLPNAANDAIGLARTFQEKCVLRQPIVLTNEKATLLNIQQSLRKIAEQSSPGDLFVFHFSGHGQGFVNLETKREYGLLILNDAPSIEQLLAGERGKGVLEVDLLDRLVSESGIQAKHRLYIVDSCYGGMGARPAVGVRGLGQKGISLSEQDRRDTLEMMMQRPAAYIITGGGARQEVLDGEEEENGGEAKSEGSGHGLLTACMIRALAAPESLDLKPIEYEGRRYLPLRNVYDASMVAVPKMARKIIDSAFDKFKQGLASRSARRLASRTISLGVGPASAPSSGASAATPAVSTSASSSTSLSPSDLDDALRELETMKKHVQAPQEDRRDGEGWVYLPLLKPGAPAPAAISEPVSTQRPGSQPAELLPYSEWAAKVGEKYQSPEYGKSLSEALRLLIDGQPPSSGSSVEQAFSADIFARPTIHEEHWTRIFEAEGCFLQGSELLAWKNEWRLDMGAGWRSLPGAGARLSDLYEYRVELKNRGNQPLYYWIIAMDAAGILQWLGPENQAWPGEYAFGKSPLASGGARALLPPETPDGRPTVWPIEEGGVDQCFIIVGSAAPWPELDQVLMRAASESFRISKSGTKETARPLNSALRGLLNRRALAEASQEIASAHALSPSSGAPEAMSMLPMLHRADGHFLILAWNIRVISSQKMYPVFKDRKGNLIQMPLLDHKGKILQAQ